jgi:hypothetical protein
VCDCESGNQKRAKRHRHRPGFAADHQVAEAGYHDRFFLGAANPRKTRTARFRRRTSLSSRRPMQTPSFVFGTVVILSTIMRQGPRSPLRAFGLDGQAEQRRLRQVGGKGADGNGRRCVEPVILNNDDGPLFAGVILAPSDDMNATASFIISIRERVDERLIILRLRTGGDGMRLAVRLGTKAPCPHIWHPDLDGAQAQGARAVAMFGAPLTGRLSGELGLWCRGHDRDSSMVTCNLSCITKAGYCPGSACGRFGERNSRSIAPLR